MQSDNMLVHYIARIAMYNVLGTLGINRVILRHKFGVPRENGVQMLCSHMATKHLKG